MTDFDRDTMLDGLHDAMTWGDAEMWDNLDAILTALALWEAA